MHHYSDSEILKRSPFVGHFQLLSKTALTDPFERAVRRNNNDNNIWETESTNRVIGPSILGSDIFRLAMYRLVGLGVSAEIVAASWWAGPGFETQRCSRLITGNSQTVFEKQERQRRTRLQRLCRFSKYTKRYIGSTCLALSAVLLPSVSFRRVHRHQMPFRYWILLYECGDTRKHHVS